MKNKLIVFDWNGTIISDMEASLRATNDCLAVYDHPPITMQHCRDIFNFPIIHFYKALGLSVDFILERADEANAAFQESYDHHARHCPTRKGARALLETLRESGARSIILSNYRTEKIEEHIKRLKLGQYFDHISAHDCDGSTIMHKTSKHGRLEHYMALHDYKAQDTIIIGDSTEEPALAKALGITSISITGGAVSTPRLRAAAPDYLVQSLSAIQGLLPAGA